MAPYGKRVSMEERFWSKVDKSGDCWVWTGARSDFGHGRFRLPKHGRVVRAHRVAWEITHGQIPDGLLVCHHCDNPPCVNPAHLFLGTYADNIHDMIDKGRSIYTGGNLNGSMMRGASNGLSKLTDEKVSQIRILYSEGQGTQESLGRLFGVSNQCISDIITRKTWTHLK